MSSNHQITPSLLKEEIEKLRAGLQEQKSLTYNSNESFNRRLNDYVERTNARLNQFSNVVDLLMKENQELKNLLVNQKFILQPVNQYQLNSNNQIVQSGTTTSSHPQISIPFNEAFLAGGSAQLSSSGSSGDQRTQQQHPQSHQQVQSQQQHQHQQQQVAQAQAQAQARAQQAQVQTVQTHGHHQQSAQGQVQQNGNIDSTLTESSTNNGMLRFINNQYVDDDQTLNNQQGATAAAQNSRNIDFVFMDPSAARTRHYRTNSNPSFSNEANRVDGVDEDDDEDEEDEDDDGSPIAQLSPPQTSRNGSTSRLQKSTTRQGEYDAENYDLIIHNDFNKVGDIYWEYQNSLKPQVERVQKAYKIKKIRKYQKIKALAVRIDRYKELKGCSLEESFMFFDNLRLAEDNTKRSIAWLYNTLPDILKKIGLEDQLKRSTNGH